MLVSSYRTRPGTTVHVVRLRRDVFRVAVSRLPAGVRLADHAVTQAATAAINGGFYTRDGEPLGLVRIAGEDLLTAAFVSPWDALRSCVSVAADELRLCVPDDADGDHVLQAGPLLVADGMVVVADGRDSEGFSAGQAQFDQDILDGRHPRSAFGFNADEIIMMSVDGRAWNDTGLTVPELAREILRAGAWWAINLDGGASSSLVADGRLLNQPRSDHGTVAGGKVIPTALLAFPR